MKQWQLGLAISLVMILALPKAGSLIRRRFPQLVIRNKVVQMAILAQGVIGLIAVWTFIAIVMLGSR